MVRTPPGWVIRHCADGAIFFFFLLSFFLVPRFRGRSCGGELKTLVKVVLAGDGRGEGQSRSVARLRPQTGKMRDSTAAAAGAVAV